MGRRSYTPRLVPVVPVLAVEYGESSVKRGEMNARRTRAEGKAQNRAKIAAAQISESESEDATIGITNKLLLNAEGRGPIHQLC